MHRYTEPQSWLNWKNTTEFEMRSKKRQKLGMDRWADDIPIEDVNLEQNIIPRIERITDGISEPQMVGTMPAYDCGEVGERPLTVQMNTECTFETFVESAEESEEAEATLKPKIHPTCPQSLWVEFLPRVKKRSIIY